MPTTTDDERQLSTQIGRSGHLMLKLSHLVSGINNKMEFVISVSAI